MKNFISTYLKNKIEGLNSINGRIEDRRRTYIYGSEIGKNVIVGEAAKIHKTYLSGHIEIGRYTAMWGPNIEIIAGINNIKIGKFCSIAKNTSIMEYNHSTTRISTYLMSKNIFNQGQEEDIFSKGSIVIGNDVWIGMNSVILSGVKIGNGAIIGAGSIVTKDVPSYAIVTGNPINIIKYRFDEHIIKILNDLKWWDWPIDRIEKNKEIFLSPKVSIEELQNLMKIESKE